MNPETLAALRQALLDERSLLQNATVQLKESGQTVELDQSKVGRLSRMDALQQQAMAQASQGRVRDRLRAVEAALGRIDRGVFGLCCACEEEIVVARLQVDPATPFCLECLAERD